MRTLAVLALLVAFSSIASASIEEVADAAVPANPELPPGAPPFVPPQMPGAQMLFDCPEGPGYLRVTLIDIWANKHYKQVFTGSRGDCQAQAALLRKTRSVIGAPSVVAVCSAQATYLVRWVAYPNGGFLNTPQTYYSKRDECLKDAAELNAKPQ